MSTTRPECAPEAVYPSGDDGRLEQYLAYHRAITEETEPEYTAAEARRNIETMIAIRVSAAEGSRAVALPLPPDTPTPFM